MIRLYPHGGKTYYNLNGQVHRENGPAYIDSSGNKYWYLYNLVHREDGPAIIYGNGKTDYFYHGMYIPVKSQEEFKRYIKLLAFE